jgi:branched-chain amino acid transport system ATP-binding protein
MSYFAVADLVVEYGPVRALAGISLTVEKGEIVAVLGANGAGKSTLLRTVSGLVKPRTGDIHFEGTSLVGMASDRIARLGIAHVPEGRRVFPGLRVDENLMVGAVTRSGRVTQDSVQQDLVRVYQLFPVLSSRSSQHGWSLSGGEAQMLAIGRALMARPRLLMLDEPSLGLAPLVVHDVLGAVHRIREEGNTVLLVEQNARAALRIADRAYVFGNGRILFEGSARELRRSERMRSAYLGA